MEVWRFFFANFLRMDAWCLTGLLKFSWFGGPNPHFQYHWSLFNVKPFVCRFFQEAHLSIQRQLEERRLSGGDVSVCLFEATQVFGAKFE